MTSVRELYTRPPNNLKSLDGLRALAILTVVCMHVNEYFLLSNNQLNLFFSNIPPFKGGWVGVQLFFVLSGFLIGGQLWKELFTKKSILFWRFIFRRGFRIWPLYYFVIIVIYFFPVIHSYDSLGLFSNVFFVGNYVSDSGPVFGSWSLATEEQFYIIAPLMLILTSSFFPEKKLVFYRKVLFFIFFIPLFLRFITWNYILYLKEFDFNTYMKYIYRPFHTNSEGLVAGMIISNFYYDKESIFYKSSKNLSLMLGLGMIVFLASFLSKIYFNFTGIAIGFSFLLVYLLKSDNGLLSKFFSHNYFFIISKTSFAIYLTHVGVIKNFLSVELIKKVSLGGEQIEVIAALIIVLTISIVISSFLYIFIEKPFMILREKLI